MKKSLFIIASLSIVFFPSCKKKAYSCNCYESGELVESRVTDADLADEYCAGLQEEYDKKNGNVTCEIEK